MLYDLQELRLDLWTMSGFTGLQGIASQLSHTRRVATLPSPLEVGLRTG